MTSTGPEVIVIDDDEIVMIEEDPEEDQDDDMEILDHGAYAFIQVFSIVFAAFICDSSKMIYVRNFPSNHFSPPSMNAGPVMDT